MIVTINLRTRSTTVNGPLPTIEEMEYLEETLDAVMDHLDLLIHLEDQGDQKLIPLNS